MCATFNSTNPDPTECVYAYDLTETGRVDLSPNVTIGDPVQISSLRWSVPYNVNDEAGNAAETVWRDIIVEEMNQNSIRNEILAQQEAVVNKAIEKAVAEERKRLEHQATTCTSNKLAENQQSTAASCPECPKYSSTMRFVVQLLKYLDIGAFGLVLLVVIIFFFF